jgi:Protein of unknown function (DUF3341)
MDAIYGLFSNSDSARRALSALRTGSPELRIKKESIIVISSVPLEEKGLCWNEQRSFMPWLAVVGGVLGGTAGYALAAFTQRTYPMPTGGMPIVALWPTGIVMYELTMLGAILTTVVTFLITARLPRYRNRIYDPEVSYGKLLVGVAGVDQELGAKVKQRLYEQGAERIKEIMMGQERLGERRPSI